VSPVKYELGFYIPEDAILHSRRRENLKSYTLLNNYNTKHVFAVASKNGVFWDVTLCGSCKNNRFG
jgi:hypothetical protein